MMNKFVVYHFLLFSFVPIDVFMTNSKLATYLVSILQFALYCVLVLSVRNLDLGQEAIQSLTNLKKKKSHNIGLLV